MVRKVKSSKLSVQSWTSSFRKFLELKAKLVYNLVNMEKSKHQFKIIVERDEDGLFVASVPALPGCHTQAKNLTELRKRIKEAILLCLEVAKQDSAYRKRIQAFASEPVFVGLEMVEV